MNEVNNQDQYKLDTIKISISRIALFPRLSHASEKEPNNWRLIGRGQGIHWEDIDEDISIEGLLAGRQSGESQESFKKWLAKRSENLQFDIRLCRQQKTGFHDVPGN